MKDIIYVGVDDLNIKLFEGQYDVPEGMSYNSYLILDEKVAVIDSVDKACSAEWFNNLDKALGERTPDFLVLHHLEPDHSGSVDEFVKKYPNATIICSKAAVKMFPQFFDFPVCGKVLAKGEGDSLELGNHTLNFIMAPMIHWPEVMMSFECATKTLFAADAFGKFGAISKYDGSWACEARRYYFNICGKYGDSVQKVLAKLSNVEINTICPLHGPILTENLSYYISLYDTWSKYEPETKGVFVAYCSLHDNTANAAKKLVEILEESGVKCASSDLRSADMAECVEDAFRYDRMVIASPTYDGGIMPVMEDFLSHLKAKKYQKRFVSIIENGSWAPQSGRLMQSKLEEMSQISVGPTVTIRTRMTEANIEELEKMAQILLSITE